MTTGLTLSDAHCPMCDAPIVEMAYEADNRRVEAPRGWLVGFVAGDSPQERWRCANWCEFKTQNRSALARFREKMFGEKPTGKTVVQRLKEAEERLAKLEAVAPPPEELDPTKPLYVGDGRPVVKRYEPEADE